MTFYLKLETVRINNRSNAFTVLKNGNVGIGPSAPTSSLHIDAVNGVLFDGLTTGGIPAEGSGSRMMWYQGKSAFRAGSVQTQWDDANIGEYSAALNFRTEASGTYSFATGYQTEASGQRATAMGSETKLADFIPLQLALAQKQQEIFQLV